MIMEFNHNSATMNTIVETFVQEETKALIYDNDQLDRWRELAQTCGLEGQQEVAQPTKSPIPFMFLKTGQVNIFETLCPVKVDVKKYNKTPIPVEILELVALSLKEDYFDAVEIWYDDKTPDPVCLGINRITNYYGKDVVPGVPSQSFPTRRSFDAMKAVNKEHISYIEEKSYSNERSVYLLGKWGDVKRDFDELKTMAFERFVGDKRVRFEKEIKEAQRGILDLEGSAHERFA